MGVEVDVVTKPEYDGHMRIIDERFDRDKERICKVEEIQANLVKLSTQFAEVIKTEHEKSQKMSDDVSDMKGIITRLDTVINTLSKNDEDKNSRITKLESEPKNKLDKIYGWFWGPLIGAIIGYITSLVFR